MLGKYELALEVCKLWASIGKPTDIFQFDKNKSETVRVQLCHWIETKFKGKKGKVMLQILAICNCEIEELKKTGYIDSKTSKPKKYSDLYLKNLQTQYRNEILKISGVENGKQLPVAMFQIDSNIIFENNKAYRKQINAKNNSLDNKINIKKDTIDKFISHCQQLLESEKIVNKVIALSFFTGRRIYQEIYYKVGTIVKNDTEMRFYNLAKKESPLYYADTEIIGISTRKCEEEIKNIRDYIQGRDWYRDDLDSETFKSKFARQVTDAFNTEVKEFFGKLEPDNLNLKTIKPHNLRALYITVLIDIFKPNYMLINHFKAKRLGHYSLLEGNIEEYDVFDLNTSLFDDNNYIPNLLVSESYNVFMIEE